MSQMYKTINKMRSTKSTGIDNTSMKTVKMTIKVLAPAILNIINQTITTNTFPTCVKTAKIIPLLKSNKEPSLPSSYRPINLIPWLSKVIENILKDQITQHLKQHNLIPPQHSGGIKYHSTTTNAITLLDMWSKLLEKDKDSVLLQLDQSAAYDVVNHEILVKKLEILGFDKNAIQLMKSYCANRQQIVTIEGHQSITMKSGERSVIQGSVMSTLLYLIYVLDFPTLFHDNTHDSKEDFMCKQPTGVTFVDDLNITVKKQDNIELQITLNETLNTTQNYMNANQLSFNHDKTKLMVMSRHPDTKKKIQIQTNKELIKHSNDLVILGITIQHDLRLNKWLEVGKDCLLKQLRNRNSALKQLAKYTKGDFRKNLANAIFQSKLMYGIQVWGTAPQYMLKRLQVEQNNAARITLGFQSLRWSHTKLMEKMKWISVNNLIKLHTSTLIHQIINTKQPQYIHINLNNTTNLNTRSSAINKLGPLHQDQGNSIYTKNTFITKSHEIYNSLPDILTAITNKKYFKTKLRKYIINNNDLPDINDKNYQTMVEDKTLKLMNPNIDLTHKRKQRKNDQKYILKPQISKITKCKRKSFQMKRTISK